MARAELKDLLRKAREVTIGEGPDGFRREKVAYKGVDFEIREPSVGDRGDILQLAGVGEMDDDGKPKTANAALLQAWCTVRLTYLAGTEERVFADRDLERVINSRVGGYMAVIGDKAISFLNVDEDEVGNDSSADQNGAQSSSSPKSLESIPTRSAAT